MRRYVADTTRHRTIPPLAKRVRDQAGQRGGLSQDLGSVQGQREES
jgi:hypothetical protein